MPKSIEQNNTGAGAIQIGHVSGNVIIQVNRSPTVQSARAGRRETGIALGGFSALFIGISLATPHPYVQAAAYITGSGLAIISGVILVFNKGGKS